MRDREEMQAARSAGLVKRHETREARAIRKKVVDEIVKAIEGSFAGRTITVHEALSLSPKDYLTQVVNIVREIGSKEAPND